MLNTIKTKANIHRVSYQGSLPDPSLKRVRLSRRDRSPCAAGTVMVEETLSLCSCMYKVLGAKTYKNKYNKNHRRGKTLLLGLKETSLLMGKRTGAGQFW